MEDNGVLDWNGSPGGVIGFGVCFRDRADWAC